MNTAELIRDKAAVTSVLKETPDGRVVTIRECKIYIPARYADYGMAQIGVDKHILGIYAMVVENKYAVCSVNAMMQIDPVRTNKVKIAGDEYYEFEFDKGSTVIKNVNLVKADTLTYLIFDEFFQKGNIPWFIGYEDLGRIFDTARKYAGANIGGQREVIELIASLVARDPNDRTQYYRTAVKSQEDVKHIHPAYIPLMSVRYGATNTLTKLGGSYFSKGVISALIDPADRPERIETILRK